MEVDEFVTKKKNKKQIKSYVSKLQLYEMFLNTDLQSLKDGSEFYVYARPEGIRCLIISGKGRTIARS